MQNSRCAAITQIASYPMDIKYKKWMLKLLKWWGPIFLGTHWIVDTNTRCLTKSQNAALPMAGTAEKDCNTAVQESRTVYSLSKKHSNSTAVSWQQLFPMTRAFQRPLTFTRLHTDRSSCANISMLRRHLKVKTYPIRTNSAVTETRVTSCLMVSIAKNNKVIFCLHL